MPSCGTSCVGVSTPKGDVPPEPPVQQSHTTCRVGYPSQQRTEATINCGRPGKELCDMQKSPRFRPSGESTTDASLCRETIGRTTSSGEQYTLLHRREQPTEGFSKSSRSQPNPVTRRRGVENIRTTLHGASAGGRGTDRSASGGNECSGPL